MSLKMLKINIPFSKYFKLSLRVSLFLMVASAALFAFKGLNYGIDFTGGTLLEVGYSQPPDIKQFRKELKSAQIQEFGNETTLLVRIQGGKDEIAELKEALKTEHWEEFRRSEYVGPKVGAEMVRKGIMAVAFSLLAMLGYIWLRFDGWQFAVAAVAALLHDVLLTLGLFSITSMEFNLAIVAAVLTIAGYSINDTVVVFDRIRELGHQNRGMGMAELLDKSLNRTLRRTIVTSLTTLLALASLYILGGEVLRGFIIAMIWGVVVGTFSSLFFAAPLLKVFKLRASP